MLVTATKPGISLLVQEGQRDTDTKRVMTGGNGQRPFPNFMEAFGGSYDSCGIWAWLTPASSRAVITGSLLAGKAPRPPFFLSRQHPLSPFLPGLSPDPSVLCPTQNKPWKKLKTVLKYSPFVVSFRKRYLWVQLSGHAGESRGQGQWGRDRAAQRHLGWGRKATELLSVV